MPDFNPSPHDRVKIGGLPYTVMPHPAVPTFAFGQEGRKAFVYQVSGGPDGGLYALKKFKEAYRLADLVEICDALARFAQWPGLEVCNRHCLNSRRHADVLDIHADLEYAVLMPWISGSTWYDMVIGMTPLSRLESAVFASAVAQVLAAIEEAGLAHCDISAANVIINPTTQHAHLIDVEDLYAPGFQPPAALPAGTDGYAHKTASGGLWYPEGDRFAGAVLIAEMAAWHDPRIRREAEEEHYFATSELQQDSARYQLMRGVLGDLDPRLPDLFDQAWYSDTLADCPPMAQWQEVMSDVHHREQVKGVVSDWKPLSIPGVGAAPQTTAKSQPQPAPAEVDSKPAPQPAAQEEPEPVQPAAASPQPVVKQQTTAPPATIIQPPVSSPVPAPSVGTRPLQVQPRMEAGGPVREWRAISVQPAPASQVTGGTRPIEIPVPEPEPEPVYDAEPEVTAPEIEAELPAEDLLDLQGESDEEYDPAYYEMVDDEVEVMAEDGAPGEELETYAGSVEVDDGDDPYYADAYDLPEAEAPVENSSSIADDIDAALEDEQPVPVPDGLYKPLLDLSHIDARNRPHLVWTESPEATYYTLQEDDNPDFFDPREYRVKGGKETRWQPPRLVWRRTGRVYYRVRAENDDGMGRWSDTVALRLGA